MNHPCKYPGCNQLLSKPGHCERHLASAPQPRKEYDQRRKRDPRLALAARIRSSQRWKATRRIKLAINPLCEDPHGTHGKETETATEAHHKQGLIDAPELAFDVDNLMSVCSRCHARIEAEVGKNSRVDI